MDFSIVLTFGDKFISVKFEQKAKAEWPIDVTIGGSRIDFRFSQLKNANSSIKVTVGGIITDVNLRPEKLEHRIIYTPVGI